VQGFARNDNDPSPQPSPTRGEGVMGEFSPTRGEGIRGAQAKAFGYTWGGHICFLILFSIICRMRKEIRATEVAPTHAGKAQ
jgi:hypothetical protein